MSVWGGRNLVFFCLFSFLVVLMCIESTNGKKLKNENKIFLDLEETLQLSSKVDYMERLGKIREILDWVRWKIFVNMAGGYGDPHCKGEMIWMEPTLTNMNETIQFNISKINTTCAFGDPLVNCTSYIIDDPDSVATEDSDIFVTTVGNVFQIAESLYKEGSDLFAMINSDALFDIHLVKYEDLYLSLKKKKKLERITKNNLSKRDDDSVTVYDVLEKIEKDFICALYYYENLFSSIEGLVADYIANNDPSFSLSDYDPYTQPNPFTVMDSPQFVPQSDEELFKSEIKAEEQQIEQLEGEDAKKKKRWTDPSVPGSINCTVRGLLPIWGNKEVCYSVRYLDDSYRLRMLYEDSRVPKRKCLDKCSKSLYAEQDYDMNDFVAKFDYMHIYATCSRRRSKKLVGAMSNLEPEAKGSKILSELRLSLDFVSDNFDESLCTASNMDHSNQNARSLLQLQNKKCTGGEISGGSWNELAKVVLFDFTDTQGFNFSLIDVPHNHTHNYTRDPDDLTHQTTPTHQFSSFQDKFGSEEEQWWVRRRTQDPVEDIVFSKVTWKFCHHEHGSHNGTKKCSGEFPTNCDAKCSSRIKKSGGKRKFIGLGVDDFFHQKNNHTLHPPFNTLESSDYIKPIKRFTTFISVPGSCGTDTEMTTPMYLLRNYEKNKCECCGMNNCKDVVLLDFYNGLDVVPGGEGTGGETNLPQSLIIGSSEKWKYPREGRSFYNELESRHPQSLDSNGIIHYFDKKIPRQKGNVMQFCHYKRKHSIHDHHFSVDKRSARSNSERSIKRDVDDNYVSYPFEYEMHGKDEWIISQHACGCDSDCVGRSVPDAVYENLFSGESMEKHHHHRTEKNQQQRSSDNDEKGHSPMIITKCMQPLGFCIGNKSSHYTSEIGLQPSKQACDYFDDCKYLGDNHYCDNSFLDDQGNGFAYCVDKTTMQPTNIPCDLPVTVNQCEKDTFCSAGDPGCYPDFFNYIDFCNRVLMLSKGQTRCQFNIINVKQHFNQNVQNNDILLNNTISFEPTISKYPNCFYLKQG